MHAERCPICGGKGKLPNDGTTTSSADIPCHGCHGKGWVEVRDEPMNMWYPNMWTTFSIKATGDEQGNIHTSPMVVTVSPVVWHRDPDDGVVGLGNASEEPSDYGNELYEVYKQAMR